jgi:hypothetical protein
MLDKKEQKPYKPVLNIKEAHKGLQAYFDPLSGNCSQEYRNWLDSAQCLMLAGLGVYAEVFVQTKSTPAEILEQIINTLTNVQRACTQGNRKKEDDERV